MAFKPGQSATAEELIAFARERLAGYKVPSSIDVVEALPRNPSGKILKRDLRKPYWGDASARSDARDAGTWPRSSRGGTGATMAPA